MNLKFTKMHGLGNDFVVINGFSGEQAGFEPTVEQVRFLAHRNFGVGCDQVLLVQPPQTAEADFRYRIWNQDGGEVEQCGNGARCFAQFVREQGLTDKDEIVVETAGGIITLNVVRDGWITVNMGEPVLEPQQIPFKMNFRAHHYDIQYDGETFKVGAISMGNPHVVLPVDNVDTAPVETLGPPLESHELFPQRVNVGFMEIVDCNHIKLRVYERGAGETLACGTGACAAVVSGIVQGDLDHEVNVTLPGGALSISWAGEGEPVMMTGPAETVFTGEIDI